MAVGGRKLLRMLAMIMFGYFLVTVYFYTEVFDKVREVRGTDDYSSDLDYVDEKIEAKRTKVDRKLKGQSDNIFIEYNEQLYQKSNFQEAPNVNIEDMKVENSQKSATPKVRVFEESDFDKKIRESAKRLEERMRLKQLGIYVNKTSDFTKRQLIKMSTMERPANLSKKRSEERSGKKTDKKHAEKEAEFWRNPNITIATENYNFRQIFSGIYLYSAFFDSREETNVLRFILIGRTKNVVNLWCLLRRNDSSEVFSSEVQFYSTCESHMKDNSVYLCSCEVPVDFGRVLRVNLTDNENQGNPVSVDVVSDIQEPPFKFKLATCVPPLFGNINILRLAEFIELSKMLGTEHLYFYYNSKESENDIHQLLEYYSGLGLVTVFPWNLTMESHEIWYHGQSAAIWDCLFRNIRVSELVSFNDIDEFIVPKKTSTWDAMLPSLHEIAREALSEKEEVAVFSFQSVFFDSNFRNGDPSVVDEFSQLLTVNVTLRTSTVSRVRTKMIVYPLKVFELGIHHLSKPLDEHFKSVLIPEDVALIHHYRTCDWNYGMNCDRIVKDDSMHKYKRKLLKRVRTTLHKINRIGAG